MKEDQNKAVQDAITKRISELKKEKDADDNDVHKWNILCTINYYRELLAKLFDNNINNKK